MVQVPQRIIVQAYWPIARVTLKAILMSRTFKLVLSATLMAIPGISVSATPPANAGPTVAALAAACKGRDGWAEPAPPARIAANTWYVGTCGISAILITGDKGHVLLDGGIPEAAPLVLANIRTAGFKPRDIKWILASHEHYDHTGALAALKQATGAKVAALDSQKATLETGKAMPRDPQFGVIEPAPPLAVDRTLADGDKVTLGGLSITAHATPVHAPGSTSWTWQTCAKGAPCVTLTYADSASTISQDAYRFTDHPDRVAEIDEGLGRLASLPCGILLTPHPSSSGMMERFRGEQSLGDPQACQRYAATARQNFKNRLARESSPETAQ